MLLVDDGPQPVELGPVQQQLAPALGLVAAVHLGVVVGGDVQGHQPRLAALDAGVGVAELRGAARSDFTSLPRSTSPASTVSSTS